MSLLLYLITAGLILWLCHRTVHPLTRVAAVALFLLPFCFTGFALLTGKVYGPIDMTYGQPPLAGLQAEVGVGPPRNFLLSDLFAQMIPWRKVVQWSLANGRWPLWNPFILSGDLLAASAQPAAYSPVTLISCLIPVAHAVTFSAAITFFIAGIGAFLLCRELGCRELVAVIAAAGWMYSTAIAFFILWPLGASWSLLPALLFAVRRAARQPGVRSAALLTTVFVLVITAGHPETTLHVIAAGAAYGLFELVRARRQSLSIVATACGAAVAAVLIGAIYILPLVEAMPQSKEHLSRTTEYEQRGVSGATSAGRLLTNLFPFLHIARWNRPDVGDVTPDNAAVGSLIVAAAIFALWRMRTPETWFFGGLLLFSLVAQAQPEWFSAVMRRIPLFDLALNERFSFAAALGLVVLGALGLEHYAQNPREFGFGMTCLLVLIVLAAGTTLLVRSSDLVSPRALPWGRYKIAAELVILAVAAALLLARAAPRYALASFLVLLLAQRMLSEGGVYPTVPARAAYPPIPLFDAIQRDRPFRIVGLRDVFTPATAALYELEDVRGYNPMTFARYAALYPLWCFQHGAWFNRVEDLTIPFLTFLNVRYAITLQADPVPPGWKEIAADRGARLLENETMMPRVFVPERVRVGVDREQTIAEMGELADFRRRAWIETSTEPHERANGPGSVNIRRPGPPYEIDVEMQNDGWIVLSDAAWRGWRAWVDGRRVDPQIANVAFVSVFVPRGHHHVRLMYMPQSFVVGRAITLLTLFVIGVTAIVWRWRRRSIDEVLTPR